LAHLYPTGILQGADIRPAGHVFTFDPELFQQGAGLSEIHRTRQRCRVFWLPAQASALLAPCRFSSLMLSIIAPIRHDAANATQASLAH
jgi:hypothetical protein